MIYNIIIKYIGKDDLVHIGSHVTISKGYKEAGKISLEMGANVFQFFTRNPRGSRFKKIDMKDISEMKELTKVNDFGPILAHGPYILNLASYKDNVYENARRILKEDYKRMDRISIPYLNIHPGNHLGRGIDYGIEKIALALNETLENGGDCMILLETMSGKGTEIGYRFEEIEKIISLVDRKELVGVCMDSCHVYSAGYDIVNDLDGVLEEFDRLIGIDRLKAIHLNDSKTEYASRKDRHAKLGKGSIGLKGIENIINHKYLKNLPFYLETPNDLDGHRKEIELLKTLRK